ncbi:MAG TPA: hypothetical protein VF163_11450 [Micromonosporaceae bacterium]
MAGGTEELLDVAPGSEGVGEGEGDDEVGMLAPDEFCGEAGAAPCWAHPVNTTKPSTATTT